MKTKHQKKKPKETGNLATIRKLNRNAALRNIRLCGSTSRVELVKALKLAPATITAVVGSLIEDGFIIESEIEPTQTGTRNRGRPSRAIRLNPNAAFSLGLSLRVEHNILFIDTSVSDYCNNIRFGSTHKCANVTRFKEVLKTATKAISELLKLLPKNANIIGLGVGIPGVVTQDDIKFSPNIPCIEGKALFQQLTEFSSFPIRFENDVNLLVVRELNKTPHLSSINFSYLLVSQGIGAGTALYGDLWQSSGWSGEIGHLQVPFDDGAPRSLEWLIGLDGYFAEKMAVEGIAIDAEDSLSPEMLENQAVKKIIESYTRYLSLAVQVLNGSFDLDMVIIGTSNKSILDFCMPQLIEIIEASPLKVKTIYHSKEKNAVAEGAALLALNHFLEELDNDDV